MLSSLIKFKMKDEDIGDPEILEQFVLNVDDFSSQYGGENSFSYTAFNLKGPPSNFPDYGDYPQAFVMRTYGTWWDKSLSAPSPYNSVNHPAIASHDFVEISFETAVYPLSVSVFETYNPGAVVRVWARSGPHWVLLWEGPPHWAGDKPRIFTPPLKLVHFATRVLRLEFNHSALEYYTELDAVLLRGRRDAPATPRSHAYYGRPWRTPCRALLHKGDILNKVLEQKLYVTAMVPKAPSPTELDIDPDQTGFKDLPAETILSILKYLDLKTLFSCAQVNRHLNAIASDSILYRRIDLRPYWHCANTQVLQTLTERCSHLQMLDLSWCGGRNMMTEDAVIKFLYECGAELTHLRIDSCTLFDARMLLAIVDAAPNLQELSLRGGRAAVWAPLRRLRHLRRLDLYRTDVTEQPLIDAVRANEHLTHLNLGSCQSVHSMEGVVVALAECCPRLATLDLWKCHGVTAPALDRLVASAALREIDVSWCMEAGGEWVAAAGGPQLRKAFLSAVRGVPERGVLALAERSPQLQQLDLLGVRPLYPDTVLRILEACPELKLLDVSFCERLTEYHVNRIRKLYPHVSIKREFQAADDVTLFVTQAE